MFTTYIAYSQCAIHLQNLFFKSKMYMEGTLLSKSYNIAIRPKQGCKWQKSKFPESVLGKRISYSFVQQKISWKQGILGKISWIQEISWKLASLGLSIYMNHNFNWFQFGVSELCLIIVINYYIAVIPTFFMVTIYSTT